MMRSLASSLVAVAVLAPATVAQCFDSNYGVSLPLPGFFDFELGIQPIGFAFPLAGTTYTDVHIASKGYVWLSNAGVPAPGGVDFSATASELATLGPRVTALWSDFGPSATGSIWLNSTPTKCTITWADTTCFAGACGVFTMQLQLLSSGEVFMFFGPGTTNNSSAGVPTWQVGVCGISPGGAASLPAASDLSAGGLTADNVVYEEWLVANTFDMASRGLQFVPTNPGWIFTLPANCAAAEAYGAGCVQENDSFYEEWLTGFDLNSSTVTWLRTPTGYVVLTSIPGTFVTPGVGAVNVAAGFLDGEQTFALSSPMPAAGGPTSSLNITTKGQIEIANSTSGIIDYTPSVSEFLNATRTQFALWHDYDQTDLGSGLILFEEIGNVTYVTWNGVHSFSSVQPSTFQFQFDRPTGNVTLVIGTMGGFANPDNGILGYSVGGPSPNPGATDLSALTGSLNVADLGLAGLAMAANGLPQVGNVGFGFTTSNVPPLVPLGIIFFGTAKVFPGLPLGIIGMPGCEGYTNSNLGSVSFPVVAGVGAQPLPIPANPGLIGAQFSAQSVAFTLLTPLGLASSNGVWLTIGN